MNENQVNQLRKKFIRTTTLAFFIVMFLMGGFVFAFSEITLRNEAREITDYIIENDGELPEGGESAGKDVDWTIRRFFGYGSLSGDSREFIRKTGYFAVLFNEAGETETVKIRPDGFIGKDEAEKFARAAAAGRFSFGHSGRYYYAVSEREQGGSIVVYIDRTGQIETNYRILFAVLLLLGAGTLLTFCVMRILSEKYLREEIERADRQKQFITNASHELKTPLSVIRANTEMQEMLEGETEWTASTMRQVDRMSGLIANLVQIARAQETEKTELVRIDLSAVAEETASSFVPVAAGEGKSLVREIEPSVEYVTDESLIRQLISLLTDNAVKYCDEGGTITVSLRKSGKGVTLQVSNHYAAGRDVDYTKFFDRFYRADTSHNADSGGYGIGLSVAENIVKTLGGTLDVVWKEGVITFRVRLK